MSVDRRLPTGEPKVVPVTGTFDFRWPRNATIRIAFQESANKAAVALAIARVEEALEAWGVSESVQPDGPALAYRIVPERFPAGTIVPDSLLKDEERKAKQRLLQAPEEEKGNVAADAAAFAEVARQATLAKPAPLALAAFTSSAFKYDVLISVAPLPVVIEGSELLKNAAKAVIYAQSELGAYARREDLGLPTAFLGRPYLYKCDTGTDPDLAWLNSREGRFTVLHEVGHILGLAHEHQNPNRKLDWRLDSEILTIIRKRRGFNPISHDFIKLELTGSFPRPKGAEPFSQWRSPTDAETAGGQIDSVMVEPVYQCMLKGQGRHRGPDCVNDAVCDDEQELYEKWTDGTAAERGPTKSDREHLKRLYPPLTSAQPSAQAPSPSWLTTRTVTPPVAASAPTNGTTTPSDPA